MPDTIRNVRDAVIHMDEWIRSARLGEGESHALLIQRDGRSATVGPYQLDLDELAELLRSMHGLAGDLAVYREKDGGQ
jgi:hypothetical protein